MTVRERIKIALERSGKTQTDLANELGVKQGTVAGVLNRESEFDSLKYIEATERLTGYRFEWIRTGQGPEKEPDLIVTDNQTTLIAEAKFTSLSTEEKLEMLVTSQKQTIALLQEKIKRLEERIAQEK